MGQGIEQTLAVLNGLVGDYLSRTGNGLATDMALYHAGRAITLDRAVFEQAFPEPQPRVVVLVHGLMSTESAWQMPDGTDYGSNLARDLRVTPAYVRYNTGLAIADNGAHLAVLLQRLVELYPIELEELLLVGYSMGGLVIRSACHVASLEQLPWLARVQRSVYVGTPHLGAPAERAGKLVSGVLQWIRDPYTRLIADIADLRSAGLKDLGHADLRHEDRALLRSPFSLRDARHPVPLLPEIAHYLIAGTLFDEARVGHVFGDALVPVSSATNRADALIPPERVHVLPGLGHLALAHRPEVYAVLRKIFEEAGCPKR
jgi:triacylglycerol lipase